MIPELPARQVALVPMVPGRDEEFAGMLEEFRAAGELDVYKGDHAIAWKGYGAFYELLSRMKAGGYPRPEIVPMDSYFIEEEGRMLGELYIRHRLSPRLEQVGGHVGYKVRPSCRNRGVATAALRLALERLGGIGVKQALVTCKANNAASARVIEKCGGVRVSDASTSDGVEWRYRIATPPPIMVTVREMRREDGRSFIEVRNAAVRGIAVKDYPSDIIENWAGPPVTEAMLERLSVNPDNGIRLVAEIEGEIVGMGELIVATNELRACYVSPSAIRKGVGSAIVREIERIAVENGVTSLNMDSSVTAEPFYKALGYEVLAYGEHVLQSGQRMACVKMRKFLRLPNVLIRQVKPDERNIVRALVQTVADETFGDLFAPFPVPIEEQDWSLAWVAISNMKVVGVVLTHDEWISDLWVLRESRGLGVGRRLLTQGESEIASRGHGTFRLRVVKSNARAIHFYIGQGWRVSREFPHEKFHHAMFEMVKSLNG